VLIPVSAKHWAFAILCARRVHRNAAVHAGHFEPEGTEMVRILPRVSVLGDYFQNAFMRG